MNTSIVNRKAGIPMKKTFGKTAVAFGLCLSLLASGSVANAAFGGGQGGPPDGGPGGGPGSSGVSVEYASEPGTVAVGNTTNSAASLTADYANVADAYDGNETMRSCCMAESHRFIMSALACVYLSQSGSIPVSGDCCHQPFVLAKLSLITTTCEKSRSPTSLPS